VTFRRLCSLKDVGIPFDVLADENASALDIVSGEGASMTFKAAGQTSQALPNIPVASAGVSVDFGREGAFVIQAEDVHEPSIKNIVKLQHDILEAYKLGKWQLGWKVVVKLTRTSNAVILVSQSAHAKVEISASGDVPVGSFKLTDASVKLALAHSSGDVVHVDRGQEVTPLFQLAGLHLKRWWWPFQREARLEKSVPTPEEVGSICIRSARQWRSRLPARCGRRTAWTRRYGSHRRQLPAPNWCGGDCRQSSA
jgi:hypothetical protein